jgi:hypothetical protein
MVGARFKRTGGLYGFAGAASSFAGDAAAVASSADGERETCAFCRFCFPALGRKMRVMTRRRGASSSTDSGVVIDADELPEGPLPGASSRGVPGTEAPTEPLELETPTEEPPALAVEPVRDGLRLLPSNLGSFIRRLAPPSFIERSRRRASRRIGSRLLLLVAARSGPLAPTGAVLALSVRSNICPAS